MLPWERNPYKGKINAEISHLIPLPAPVQSDYDHGGIDQISITVEGKVCVLPRHVQHVPVKRDIDSLFNYLTFKIMILTIP